MNRLEEEKRSLKFDCPICGVTSGNRCRAMGRYGRNHYTRYAHAERYSARPKKLNPERQEFAFSDLLDIKD